MFEFQQETKRKKKTLHAQNDEPPYPQHNRKQYTRVLDVVRLNFITSIYNITGTNRMQLPTHITQWILISQQFSIFRMNSINENPIQNKWTSCEIQAFLCWNWEHFHMKRMFRRALLSVWHLLALDSLCIDVYAFNLWMYTTLSRIYVYHPCSMNNEPNQLFHIKCVRVCVCIWFEGCMWMKKNHRICRRSQALTYSMCKSIRRMKSQFVFECLNMRKNVAEFFSAHRCISWKKNTNSFSTIFFSW